MKKKVKIKDIALYSKGTQINGDELLEEAKFDYLNGGIKPSGKWDNANCVANTVAISEGGNSCGYVNFMKNPFWCGAHCYFLYDTKIDSKYLYYALKSQQVRIMKLRSGACMPNIKKTDLGNFEFVCDDNSIEQKKITHILDKLECVIEQRKNEIQVFDELVKARFVELFGDPILNPKNWNCMKIGDVVNEVKYGTSLPAVEGGKYPYLRMNNLTSDGYLDLTNLKYIDVSDDELEKCIVRYGDVLFNRTNSIDLVGKTAVYNLHEEMVIAGYIIRIRLNGKILPEVFSQYMNLNVMKEKLRSMAKGAVNQANINAKELQGIKIYVPDMELQKHFIDLKNQVDKSKAVIEKSLKELETLQASLMQKYFS